MAREATASREPRPGLYVVTGPSGVGKGTVIAELGARLPGLVVSVSATTRAPRLGELDGVHYHFLDEAAFDTLVAADGFLEWARFGGHRYGTLAAPTLTALADGHAVVLEIDVQGALQVRRRFADAVLVFIRPPSVEALAQRLRSRGTDSSERIAQRLAIAGDELAHVGAFDHVIVNDEVERAVAALMPILSNEAA